MLTSIGSAHIAKLARKKMGMEVLQGADQNRNARRELIRMGISQIDSLLYRSLRILGLRRGISIGDFRKSWDVLLTLTFLNKHLTKTSAILDLGCFASETIVALHQLGYSDLYGADLDPRLELMPYKELICYETVDFMHTSFCSNSFDAIVSTSVIEHGFDGHALFTEVSRLLRPGGYFIASFDYWPAKLDTSGIEFFGMSWTIFSEQEIRELLSLARAYGLTPVGPLNFKAKNPPIRFGGKKYTFGWLALSKIPT